MNKIKISLVLISFLMMNITQAQTVEQGKKYLYYEKYKSAKDAFQKVLNTDPNNEEAIYGLGQSMILSDETSVKELAEAKAFYQSKLTPTSALIIVGVAHIELLEGKLQDARNHFEAAINLTQGKNIAVLNAIGYANGNPDAKNGDAVYAIDKLTMATKIKKFNDPEVLVNLGDAYRKNNDGGNAILSYQAALALNPKYARAEYRIGKIYQSQGKGQENIFMEHYNNAISSDAFFAPVYANLFNYFYETDVTKAADYFEKWLANSDEDKKTCYYRASLKYAQGFFDLAINKADECIKNEGENPYPNLFGLKANAYNRLKDSIKAIQNFAEYIKRQAEDKITTGDYIEYAKNLLKVPGNEALAGTMIDKAIALDTLESNKVAYLKSIASFYDSKKNYKEVGNWYAKIVAIKKSPSKYDINTTGFNYYRAGAFQEAINAFTLSSTKFPDDPYAYNMIGKASWAIDTSMTMGLANAAYEKAMQLSMADTIKNKAYLMNSYKYFVAYYANIMKDKNMAVSYVEKALALDPTDAEANSYKAALLSTKESSTNKPAKKP